MGGFEKNEEDNKWSIFVLNVELHLKAIEMRRVNHIQLFFKWMCYHMSHSVYSVDINELYNNFQEGVGNIQHTQFI